LIFFKFVSFHLDDTVGDYRIIGELGSGGMGTVYKVQHQISQRVEALKVLLPDLARSPDLADRFIREIRVQASLNHPHIASLHNAFHSNNQLLMVMEYIDGISLYMRLKQGPVSLWHGVNIISQTLSALSYAHAHGVVHRDVKPANIMLTNNGVVKLMDFGIARSASNSDRNLTQTGFAIGSAHYMAPEQVRGQPADARSDIYSAGVTLFELVTGARPFSGMDTYEIMNAHVTAAPPDPAGLNAGVPPGLSSVILKALEKNPGRRFQTGDEFFEALQRLVNAQFGTANPAGMMETVPFPGIDAIGPQTPIPDSMRRTRNTQEGHATPSTPSAGAKSEVFSEDRIEALRKDLAQYVGPMARVLVDRALKRAANWKAAYELLALEVPAGKDRERFLASRPRS
jgi:eukaryotic-like serine/threonine-protein kinase